ncbi:hypothetical protein LOTGIDRAFT_239064 [Lottia gigantea]|uniref:Uncharacterized protein n=1 Tax=Lottia gigantea TaxID=225164 RepID=V4AX67_LOTGI|nr:hypothetical protein LOTGIDRAFT_239064 [Lottia gigantea]ESO98156.1 hypothetical protein LOTGIDRAFT_239064 [Lottia gigantea]
MQLTRLLCYYQHRMKVPGLLYAGKNKLVKPVTVEKKRQALNQLLLQKQNHDILSRPYLSKEVSSGHTKNSGQKLRRFEEIIAKRKHKMLPHCSYETEIRRSLELRKGWGSIK